MAALGEGQWRTPLMPAESHSAEMAFASRGGESRLARGRALIGEKRGLGAIESRSRMNDGDTVFEVIVRHNTVQAIRRTLRAPGMHVPDSNLEVTSELARNHQLHGCIDGCYRFDEPERARSFAVLALDFVKRMIEKRIEQIESLDTGAGFESPEHAASQRQ